MSAAAPPCGATAGAQTTCPKGGGRGMGSLLFLPASWAAGGEPLPMIVFLHGAGESGSDPRKVALQGPPKLVEPGHPMGWGGAQTPHAFLSAHFIVLSVQSHRGGFDGAEVNALVRHMTPLVNADPKWLYLTGVSMGGYGTWATAMDSPALWAAIAPICGGAAPSEVVAKLKDKPTRVYHGSNDVVIPVAQSDAIVAALKKAGSKNLVFERFVARGSDPNWQSRADLRNADMTGHASWVRAYDESDELYEWFLSHSL